MNKQFCICWHIFKTDIDHSDVTYHCRLSADHEPVRPAASWSGFVHTNGDYQWIDGEIERTDDDCFVGYGPYWLFSLEV